VATRRLVGRTYLAAALTAAAACSTGSPATQATTSGASSGNAGAAASGSESGSGIPQATGASGSGSGALASTSGIPSQSGAASSGGDDAAVQDEAAGQDAGPQDASDSAVVTASCAGSPHPLCIDFEDSSQYGPSGKGAPWTLPPQNAAVDQSNPAHGRYAMHLSNLTSIPKNGSGNPALYLQTPITGIQDTMWGRFYLSMAPGGPMGHGVIVRADDEHTNWDELGFEYNSYMGDWHTGFGGNPEKYEHMGSIPIPMKTYACVEFYFDGKTPAEPRIWADGVELTFGSVGGPAAAIQAAGKFVTFKIGIVFYHGGSLTVYGDDTPPALTDEWIDDVAVDTTRIGCLL
jgi:hypothetical protein